MICANFTIENIVNKGTNITIVPFGANGRTKLDFENLEDEEVIADAVTSIATVDDHFGPPDIVSSIMARPTEEGAQETSSPAPQDETKKQDEQDFHEADLD